MVRNIILMKNDNTGTLVLLEAMEGKPTKMPSVPNMHLLLGETH